MAHRIFKKGDITRHEHATEMRLVRQRKRKIYPRNGETTLCLVSLVGTYEEPTNQLSLVSCLMVMYSLNGSVEPYEWFGFVLASFSD